MNCFLVWWNKYGGIVIVFLLDDWLYDINIFIFICGDVYLLFGFDFLFLRKGNNLNKLFDFLKVGVNIVFWNICYILNKFDELVYLFFYGNIDIFGF